MSGVIEEAKRYASLSWPIIPDHTVSPDGACSCRNPECENPGKHPRIKAWTVGASTAPAVLERWGREYPEMNISVLTGPRSNLAVLDVDPRNGGAESLSALFSPEELETLRTPIALTGGGGNHYYFKYPGSPFKSIPNLLPGIELKADGSKVTLPPSLHKSGERYAWETSPFDVEPAPLPQKVLELIVRKRQKDRTTYGEGEPIPNGERNNRLTALAGALRKQGACREAIEAALMKINEKQCTRPLEEREILAIAKSVSRYKPEPTLLPKNRIPNILSAAELQKMVFPPAKWAVPSLIPEGLTILAGAPKTGKSFFALSVCLSIAQGGIALSAIETSPGEVLLIALEDPMRRLQERIESLALGEAWPERLHILNECPRAHEGGVAFLDNWLEEHPDTRLVVIDTFQKFRKPQGGNSNAYEVDYEAAGGLKAIADKHGVGILVLHHTRKGETIDPLEAVSGTMGLSGAADTILVLKRAKGQGKADLFITGRDVEEHTLALRFDDLGWKLEGNADEVRITEGRQEILSLLKSSLVPLSPKKIAEGLERKNNSTIRNILSKMADKGQILNLGGTYCYAGSGSHERD
ncbi:MAG: AAA family ATPase [Veillonellaceae bacterium]|nr:AAA family ATPase [Veillonellaceae bacterium]